MIGPIRSAAIRQSPVHQGFTLIELVLAMGIIALLVGLLLAGLASLRRSAQVQQVRTVLALLAQAMETYRAEDGRHRYPPVCALDACLSRDGHGGGTGVLGLFAARGSFAPAAPRWDDLGRLLDPWGGRFGYSLVRPVVATPVPAFTDWNWDTAAGHERRWGARRDPATGVVADGALPFPYLWSLGRVGSSTDGTGWIHPDDSGVK